MLPSRRRSRKRLGRRGPVAVVGTVRGQAFPGVAEPGGGVSNSSRLDKS